MKYSVAIILILLSLKSFAAPTFNGNVDFASSGNLVSFTCPEVYNSSNSYTTGNIGLIIYGTYVPYYGVTPSVGTALWTEVSNTTLSPGGYLNRNTATVLFNDAPTNYNYLFVGLYEYLNGSWYLSDYRTVAVSAYFSPPVTIPPPTVGAMRISYEGTTDGRYPNYRLSLDSVAGENLSYQWQYNDARGGAWQNVQDAMFYHYSEGSGYIYSNPNASSLYVAGVGYQNPSGWSDPNYRWVMFKAGLYRVVVSNSGGSTASESVLIDRSTPPPSPAITSNPSSAVLNAGESAVLSVTASGTGLSYLWKKDGQNIANSNTTSLIINSVTLSDSGDYTVTVSNSSGSVTSNVANISVRTQLETWKMSYFTGSDLSEDEISGNLGDPDDDGLSNLLEFALNQDPTKSNTVWYDDMNMQNIDGTQHLVVSYIKRKNDMSISLVIEKSLNLNADDWSPVTAVPQLLSSDATTEVWQHSLSVDSSGSKFFYRLRVVE